MKLIHFSDDKTTDCIDLYQSFKIIKYMHDNFDEINLTITYQEFLDVINAVFLPEHKIKKKTIKTIFNNLLYLDNDKYFIKLIKRVNDKYPKLIDVLEHNVEKYAADVLLKIFQNSSKDFQLFQKYRSIFHLAGDKFPKLFENIDIKTVKLLLRIGLFDDKSKKAIAENLSRQELYELLMGDVNIYFDGYGYSVTTQCSKCKILRKTFASGYEKLYKHVRCCTHGFFDIVCLGIEIIKDNPNEC